uniref:Uncharacterized protein n=1 Tax=Arion vulgaris TaxID=1028688 RepID=A0A0B6Z9M5_9EUPU
MEAGHSGLSGAYAARLDQIEWLTNVCVDYDLVTDLGLQTTVENVEDQLWRSATAQFMVAGLSGHYGQPALRLVDLL